MADSQHLGHRNMGMSSLLGALAYLSVPWLVETATNIGALIAGIPEDTTSREMHGPLIRSPQEAQPDSTE